MTPKAFRTIRAAKAALVLLVFGFGVARCSCGQTFELLHILPSSQGYPEGANPQSGLTVGSDGALYGTTSVGSTNVGTIFRITTNGAFNVVSSAVESPQAPLFLATDAQLYGTDTGGGASPYGTVFRITTNGVLATIFSFHSATTGWWPNGIVQGRDGYLYGTCQYGGRFGSYGVTFGTVFSITTNGDLRFVISLDGTNGSAPLAGLTQGSDGNFYGTTSTGGGPPPPDYNGYYDWGNGTAFRLTPNGQLTTIAVYSTNIDGGILYDLCLGNDGDFYGVGDGPAESKGAIFRMDTDGALHTIAVLNGTNAAMPNGLIQAKDGNFYGTTMGGGDYGYGSVFKMTTSGMITTLFSFPFSNTNGYYPIGNLAEANDGNLYGVTEYGPYLAGDGVIFRLVLPHPTLRITQNAGQIMICWPTNCVGFTLQSSRNPTAKTWIDETGTPSNVGTNFCVRKTISDSVNFFRLRK